MQDADMFESFKVLVMPEHAVINVQEWTEKQMNVVIETSKNSDYEMIACFSTDDVFWANPKVKVVSTGEKWALVEEYIKYLQNNLILHNDKNDPWHVGLENLP